MNSIFKKLYEFQNILIISFLFFSCSPNKLKSDSSTIQTPSALQPISQPASQLPTRTIAAPPPVAPVKTPVAPITTSPTTPVVTPISPVIVPVAPQPANTLLAPNISLNL